MARAPAATWGVIGDSATHHAKQRTVGVATWGLTRTGIIAAERRMKLIVNER